jgi:hypothetical protein
MTEFNQQHAGVRPAMPGDAMMAALLHGARVWAGLHGELLSGSQVIWLDGLRWQQAAIDAAARSLQQVFAPEIGGSVHEAAQAAHGLAATAAAEAIRSMPRLHDPEGSLANAALVAA